MSMSEIYRRFPTEVDCIRHLEQIRWNSRAQCPYCNSPRTTPIPKVQRHHCKKCNTTFSVTVNTIFHHTHLPLQKWFAAIILVSDPRQDITTRRLAEDLEVNKDTAWRV